MNIRQVFSIAVFSIFFIIIIPFLMYQYLNNIELQSLIKNQLDLSSYELLDILVNYLSICLTLLLGVIVYFQSQRINKLQSTQYDIFVGVDSINYSHEFLNQDLAIGMNSSHSEFIINQLLPSDNITLFTYLNINDMSKQGNLVFLPLSFITKNQPLITSISFERISLYMSLPDRHIQKEFSNNRSCSYRGILQNNSNFFLGIGMHVPKSFIKDSILLTLVLGIEDQIGRKESFIIEIGAEYIEGKFFLTSSTSKKCHF